MSTDESKRDRAKAAAKKAVDRIEDAAEQVTGAVRDGFDKVIESIDDLQKPHK